MALDEPKEKEQPVRINGVPVLMTEYDQILMEDTVVDYVIQQHVRVLPSPVPLALVSLI